MFKSLQLRVKLNHSNDHVTDRNEKYGCEGRGSSLHSAQLPYGLLSNGQPRRETDSSHPLAARLRMLGAVGCLSFPILLNNLVFRTRIN